MIDLLDYSEVYEHYADEILNIINQRVQKKRSANNGGEEGEKEKDEGK